MQIGILVVLAHLKTGVDAGGSRIDVQTVSIAINGSEFVSQPKIQSESGQDFIVVLGIHAKAVVSIVAPGILHTRKALIRYRAHGAREKSGKTVRGEGAPGVCDL